MLSIFDYTDYREYLQDIVKEMKKEIRGFSYEWIRRRTSFENRGFVYNLLNGKRYFNVSYCFEFSHVFGHNKREAEYFKTIVNYANAKNEKERTFLLEQIQEYKNAKATPVDLIGNEKLEYYSNWYHSAIRSLIDMIPTSNNFELLSKLIFPPISLGQVKASIELLERLQLIEKDSEGFYRISGKSIKASGEIPKRIIDHFHIENTELAKQSIMYSPTDLRFVSSVTLGISEETYRAIYAETLKFRDAIVELANKDECADRVYQYQFVFFPMSVKKKRST